jgi:hypothetical protein
MIHERNLGGEIIFLFVFLDCFASLAMTKNFRGGSKKEKKGATLLELLQRKVLIKLFSSPSH